MGQAAQVPDRDQPDLGDLVLGRAVPQVLAAHHVQVQPRPADVLADLVHQQDVGRLEGKTGHPAPGLSEQGLLSLQQGLGPERPDPGGPPVAVFHHGQSGQNGAFGQDLPGHAGNDLPEAEVLDGAMVDPGAVVFAQPDQHHLHEAAFDLAREERVGLYPIADHHVVGLVGLLVEMDREAFGGPADLHGIHAGSDGAAAKGLGDSVGLEDVSLAPGGRPAVASHGGNDEGVGAQSPEVARGGLQDPADVGDPPASGGDGHRLAAPDLLAQRKACKLSLDRAGGVSQLGSLETLPDAKHLREFSHLAERFHWKLSQSELKLQHYSRAGTKAPSPLRLPGAPPSLTTP